ncbi:hypothetical protein EON81_20625 [bacterium]|nr:MAG: hypothetical protein EON81_20625 [bacterium]
MKPRFRWRKPGAGGYAALAVAALLSLPAFTIVSPQCADRTRVTQMRIVALEPEEKTGGRETLAPQMAMDLWTYCDPNDDCTATFIPLSTGNLTPVWGVPRRDPQPTSEAILASFPGNQAWHRRTEFEESSIEITITAGPDPERRRIRLEWRENGVISLHGDLSLAECL